MRKTLVTLAVLAAGVGVAVSGATPAHAAYKDQHPRPGVVQPAKARL